MLLLGPNVHHGTFWFCAALHPLLNTGVARHLHCASFSSFGSFDSSEPFLVAASVACWRPFMPGLADVHGYAACAEESHGVEGSHGAEGSHGVEESHNAEESHGAEE